MLDTYKDIYAPIALFVYDRLEVTRTTVEHLLRNKGAEHTILYVFSDGPKDAVAAPRVEALRDYLHTIEGFDEIHIIERPENYYLERNITEGIAQVLSLHDRIIVVEDDICTSPYFLTYMNEALTYYKDTPNVWQVSGFTTLDIPEYGDTYFTHHISGWGWATWRDRWQHFYHYKSRGEALAGLPPEFENRIQLGGNFRCLTSLDKNPIPWDICWEIQFYRNNVYCLHPTHTLVRNLGLRQGTHFSQGKLFGWYGYDRPYLERKVKIGGIRVDANPEIEYLLSQSLIDHGMRYNLFGKIVRWLYFHTLKKIRKPKK